MLRPGLTCSELCYYFPRNLEKSPAHLPFLHPNGEIPLFSGWHISQPTCKSIRRQGVSWKVESILLLYSPSRAMHLKWVPMTLSFPSCHLHDALETLTYSKPYCHIQPPGWNEPFQKKECRHQADTQLLSTMTLLWNALRIRCVAELFLLYQHVGTEMCNQYVLFHGPVPTVMGSSKVFQGWELPVLSIL